MPKLLPSSVEEAIRTLSKAGFSYSNIIKQLKKDRFDVPKSRMGKIGPIGKNVITNYTIEDNINFIGGSCNEGDFL